jgi:hypothetical protein
MEFTETVQGRVALAFAQAIAGGDYSRAHGMLSSRLAQELSAADLEDAYTQMVSDGGGRPSTLRVMGILGNWAGRRDDDIGWAYVAMTGDDVSEAVAVVVANEGKKPVIRELEWGAP